MQVRTKKAWLAGLAGLVALSVSAAPSAPNTEGAPVSSHLEAFRVVAGADGKEHLVPTEEISPGDVIEYRVRYSNRGRGSLRNLTATLPIPASTRYLPGTASPRRVMASTGGEDFGQVPLRTERRLPDGRVLKVKVPYERYRALRWDVGSLTPGETILVRARAQVLEK